MRIPDLDGMTRLRLQLRRGRQTGLPRHSRRRRREIKLLTSIIRKLKATDNED